MIAVILSLAWLPIASCVCIQCASPSLANLWQITGLPRRPGSLAFHPQCSALTDMADLKLPSMGLDTCSSLCFEMVIPFEAPKTNCVKSMYYDGTGADDKKNSCSGAYCTKVEGKLNGRKYVERGCAPISPYVTDVCFNIRSNTTFMSGPGDGGIVSRSKRSLDAILHGKECFCS
ncbi:unnamed protein product [Nippostrongylus brasiliensis]|uniref:Basic tail protein n=1 Tax=Nippostrongylus brasiliensis TaxID=27835 RepID=A0A0N4XZ77_NIPBR|nr:unnamed protein product [Nippostrongylus brasiliensis]